MMFSVSCLLRKLFHPEHYEDILLFYKNCICFVVQILGMQSTLDDRSYISFFPSLCGYIIYHLLRPSFLSALQCHLSPFFQIKHPYVYDVLFSSLLNSVCLFLHQDYNVFICNTF